MLQTPRSRRGMVTSPHHLASAAGLDVLKAGGTAVEAAVATAAMLAVVYPHMTHIGGDGFWLIAEPGRDPVGVEAAGRAGAAATPERYAQKGLSTIPIRGPDAANMVAGTISGWQRALEISAGWQPSLPLERLLEAAIHHAETGIVVTRSQEDLTRQKRPELQDQPGFSQVFLPGGEVPAEGSLLKQPAMAETLRRLAARGLDGFYRGDLARAIAADLARCGALVGADDLAAYNAEIVTPLSVKLRTARLFNMVPPTQGLASLMILALFDRLGVAEAESFDHLHGLVEATKRAFLVRDEHVGCPSAMTIDPAAFLDDRYLDDLATGIDRDRALPWPYPPVPGDTVWMGVIDGQGRSVSFIQSIFFEFGSGLVLPETGIVWQNRGSAFQLSGNGPRLLAPGRKPFHTLNPAMACFDDGRTMVYGTMGGEGQPQTQAAVFSRYGMFGIPLQEAVTAPRWLLGKTWGEGTIGLKLEDRFPGELVARLETAGHAVEVVDPFTSMMGHAGAIVRRPDGVLEGATDPRSDGAVAAW